MKVLLALVMVALIVYVSGEPCRTTQDCTSHSITSCGTGYQLQCHNHQCECLRTGSSGGCQAVADCPDCDHNHVKHCIDNHCRCGRN